MIQLGMQSTGFVLSVSLNYLFNSHSRKGDPVTAFLFQSCFGVVFSDACVDLRYQATTNKVTQINEKIAQSE